MSEWELLGTGLTALAGSWSFVRVVSKEKQRQEREVERLHARSMRRLRQRKMLEETGREIAEEKRAESERTARS